MKSNVENSFEAEIADEYAKYESLSDEELIVEIKEKENTAALDYLIHRYRSFVRAKARSYFLIGADREDIIQEGMIGFYKAVRDFKSDKLSSFHAFAELCVTRQIITAIKTATRQKHIPLNSYISLNKPIYDEDSDRTLLDVISGVKVADPEELIISREEFLAIEKKMSEILSELEWQVLMAYLDGKSYQEIATSLDRHVKSIDNALQRVKRKLERYVASRGEAIDIGTVYRGLSTLDRNIKSVNHKMHNRASDEEASLNFGGDAMRKINREKILSNGFEVDGENFIRRQKISDMTLTIIIDKRGSVTTKLFDADGEPYTLHLVEGASGSFVGAIKAEYECIMKNIFEQCFDEENFKAAQTLKLIEYIREKFSGEPEFLWEKFPNFAVFRRKDNRKWYAVIMTITKNKLGLDGAEEIEILNLRIKPEDLDKIFDGEKYFRGWHMNKKSWLTIRLDETLTFDEIIARLEESYRLAKKK